MNRTVAGILILLSFTAGVVYLTAQQFSVKCEVCVSYAGGRVCETALAATREDARQQATGSACSRLTSGVTDTVRCTGIRPETVRCED
jgi:hypothetical protein